MKTATEKYRRILVKKLRCCKSTKMRLITSLAPTFETFSEENPNADYEALCVAFGSPEDMAKQLTQKITNEEQQKFRTKNVVCIAALSVLAALFIGFTIYVYVEKSIPTVVEYDVTDLGPSETTTSAN